jgi:cephalosporin hydroxylase
MRTASIEKYMNDGFKSVEGWCSPYVADMVGLIDVFQRRAGCSGGVAEVGIHHGKLFLLLNATCERGERSFAIDLFDSQDLNIDHSGMGDRSRFESNLRRFDRHAGANVTIVAGDSTTAETQRQVDRPVRMFSVDGGHTVEHTLSDLAFAQRCIVAAGVVVLDDILNAHWLGVIEGAMRYLMQRPLLVPFAIGHNKLLLANLPYARRYYELFASSALCTKPGVEFLGYRLVAM